MNEKHYDSKPNSVIYCSTLQLVILLDVLIYIDKNDPMFSFLVVMEVVNFSNYVSVICSDNINSCGCSILLKIFLFAYSRGKRFFRNRISFQNRCLRDRLQ